MNCNKKKRLVALFTAIILVFVSSPLSIPARAKESLVVLTDDFSPLDVYILNLSGVGSYRASNHSKVVEGALEAATTREFGVSLELFDVLHVNLSTTVHVISDWEAYRMLIEWGKNVIVINTHDEYLPVPSGYAGEEWVDKIADFMLNRWGTWAHTGGYPLFRLWYQNGTKEEWGEAGFKTLMNYVGRGNITCYPPAELESYLGSSQSQHPSIFEAEYLGGWHLDRPGSFALTIGGLTQANVGYPIDMESYRGFEGRVIYALNAIRYGYLTGCILHFAPNQTAFNFGIYVHQSAWRFFDASDTEWPSELEDRAMGFIATAAAIYGDIGDAAYQIHGTSDFTGSTPQDRIQVAKLEGRTAGLDKAEELLQKAIAEYNTNNYKLAFAYAKQAKNAADSATQPNLLPQIIVGMAVAFTTIGVGLYYKDRNEKRKKKIQSAPIEP